MDEQDWLAEQFEANRASGGARRLRRGSLRAGLAAESRAPRRPSTCSLTPSGFGYSTCWFSTADRSVSPCLVSGRTRSRAAC